MIRAEEKEELKRMVEATRKVETVEIGEEYIRFFVNAVKTFAKEYVKALRNPVVKKPVSKALYETWKWYDAIEKERTTGGETC